VPLVAAFCRTRPQVRLTLESGGTRSLCERVAAGALPLAVCSPPPYGAGLAFEPLYVQRLALLVPEHHPLAQERQVRLEDLRRERLLLSEPDCSYRQVTETALLPHGIVFSYAVEISSIETVKYAVQQGMGVAIIPIVSGEAPLRGTALREVAGVPLGLSVGLVRRRGETHTGRLLTRLIDELRATLKA